MSQKSHSEVWNNIRNQLKWEISEIDYKTWLEPTEGLSLSHELLIVRCSSAEAQLWLTNRITAYSNRASVGVLGYPVKVVFEYQPIDEPQVIPENETLNLNIEYASDYDAIVKPERVIVVPAYFFRHIRRLGPELAWMVVGFRQAAYLAGFSEGGSFQIPASTICQFSGINRATFWRRVKKTETWSKLTGFVSQRDDQKNKYEIGTQGQLRQAANEYTVSMTIPLTPIDSRSLLAWLMKQAEISGNMSTAIQLALVTPPDKLIPMELNLANQEILKPTTVHSLIIGLGGSELEALQLQEHLMPTNDIILVRHYFAKHWVPKLGFGLAWLITWMRDLVFENEGIVSVSFQELADLINVNRLRTIRNWFAEEDTLQFIVEVNKRKVTSSTQRTFKVRTIEPFELVTNAIQESGESVANATQESNESVTNATQESSESVTNATQENSESVANATVNLLKDLTKDKSLLDIKESLTTTLINESLVNLPSGEKAVVVDDPKKDQSWDLDMLLKHNRVNQKSSKTLVKNNIPGWAFVSWILYGISQSRIDNPVGLAISKLTESPVGSGGGYDQLAKLGPQELGKLIERGCGWSGDKAWDNLKLSHTQVSELAELLIFEENLMKRLLRRNLNET
ncbi:MAG: hypothetical protein JEZ06_23840 [Anaerolineaceae bacterium]|nr:hypothetical protein [Anaerolineaceae bacterium]